MSWFFAHHIRHAITLSPAWEGGRINKVRVSRKKGVEFKEAVELEDLDPEDPEDLGKPHSYKKENPDDLNPLDAFDYDIIPFPGFDEKGARVVPANKSAGEGSSKSSGKGKKK